MKKITFLNFACLLLFLLVVLMPIASAASFNFEAAKQQVSKIIDSFLGILSPVFEKIIGDYSSSDFFFHKILLFILLLIICKNILDRTPIGEGNKRVSFLISLIISILAIRFISQNSFFESIFIQYGVLGIAITTILPMVIFFYFIQHTNVGTFGRRVFWTLYAVTLTGIWISKASEAKIPEVANWIYGITLSAALIFIVFDKSIHSYFGMSELTVFEKMANKKRIRELKKDLDELNDHLTHGRITSSEFIREKRAIEDHIRELSRE